MGQRRSKIPRVNSCWEGGRIRPRMGGVVLFLFFDLSNLPSYSYCTLQTILTASCLCLWTPKLRLPSQSPSPKNWKHLPGCPTCEAEALRPCYRIGVVPTGIEACDWPRDVLDLCWLMHLRRPKRVYQPVTFRTIYPLRL